jgi:hypothetical protein
MPQSKTKTPTKKKPAAKPVQTPAAAPAKRSKLARKRVSDQEKRTIISGYAKISPAHKLFMRACGIITRHSKLLGGVLLVYAVLDILLVGGANATNLQSAKVALTQTGHGGNQLVAGISLFTFLVSSSGSGASAAAGAYQTMLLLLVSVVFIWALRQAYAGHAVRIREAFYAGAYPIVPFVLILLVIGLQLVPLAVGATFYTIIISNGISVGIIEQAISIAIFLLFAAASLYMICSSVVALYIVTLPDMTPVAALRSAGKLVRFRRWVILRKLLFLPFVVIVLAGVIVIPFALFVTPYAPLVFLVVAASAIGVVHSYLYALYRELI